MKTLELVLCLLLVFTAVCHAFYDKKKYEQIFNSCKLETGATDSFGGPMPKSPTGMCLIECIMRTKGFINKDGSFSNEGAKKYFDEVLQHKPDVATKALEIARDCHFNHPVPEHLQKNKCQIAYAHTVCAFTRFKEEGINVREEKPED